MVVVVALAGAAVLGWMHLAKQRAERSVERQELKGEISELMRAISGYRWEMGEYPPGGTDANGDGDLDDPGDELGAGGKADDPRNPKADRLKLRILCVRIPVDGGARESGPCFELGKSGYSLVDDTGQLCDRWGKPYRYLTSGGARANGPVLWSVGPDGKQDAGNNARDDDGDGLVDEEDEIEDDVCSWWQ